MSIAKLTARTVLLIMLSLLPLFAPAGPGVTGGGIYGYADGRWVLLDKLEHGQIFDPLAGPASDRLRRIVDGISREVPNLGAKLYETKSNKVWHLVDFPLQCENVETQLNVELSVGACQDANDVWINREKLAEDRDFIILHELVQGLRVAANMKHPDKAVPARSVRAVTTELNRLPVLSAPKIQELLNRYQLPLELSSEEVAVSVSKELKLTENEKAIVFDCTYPAQAFGYDGGDVAFFIRLDPQQDPKDLLRRKLIIALRRADGSKADFMATLSTAELAKFKVAYDRRRREVLPFSVKNITARSYGYQDSKVLIIEHIGGDWKGNHEDYVISATLILNGEYVHVSCN